MSPRSDRVLQAAERERLVLLGADEGVLRRLAAWAGRDGTMGRVYAVDPAGVSVATAAGVTGAVWAVDSLPVIGDWVLVAGDEVVDVLQAEETDRDTFVDLDSLAERCRFADCRHGAEPGCAVVAALSDGSLDPSYLHPSRAEAHEQRRGDTAARQRHKQMWMAREADGDSRARP